MLTCIIIEDQAPAQRILKRYIADYGDLELRGTFTNATEAGAFLQTEQVDILFLDIHLPRISGMTFVKQLSPAPATIFTTAFTDYAAESYELEAVDYLVKPFSYDRFVKAVTKAVAGQHASKIPGLDCIVKSGHSYYRIPSPQIVYIRTDMDYTEIHLQERKYISGETLVHWEQQLAPHGFVRVHKSHLVNLAHVEKLGAGQLFLHNGLILPIGRAYKEQVFRKWTGFSAGNK